MPAVEREVLYLAYGANMSSRKLVERGVTTSGPGHPAVASGRIVSFSHRGGFATLLHLEDIPQKRINPRQISPLQGGQSLESACHGVVYSITERDMQRLAAVETGYRRTKGVAVVTYGGQWLEAEAFVSQPSLTLSTPVPPTKRYLELMREGAREHSLMAEYVSWLGGVQSWDGMSQREPRYDTPSALYANLGLACTFGVCIALSLIFLH